MAEATRGATAEATAAADGQEADAAAEARRPASGLRPDGPLPPAVAPEAHEAAAPAAAASCPANA